MKDRISKQEADDLEAGFTVRLNEEQLAHLRKYAPPYVSLAVTTAGPGEYLVTAAGMEDE